MHHVTRRQFTALLGGSAVAWPLAARSQQAAMPVIGFLSATSPETTVDRMRAFHLGLKETGYVEGDNITILYRWAENHIERLPDLAADLARRRVAVLATYGNSAALAAKAVTTTVPIVFGVSEDPVRFGLVASLARPDSNLTGVSFLSTDLAVAAATPASAGSGEGGRTRRPGRSPDQDDVARGGSSRWHHGAANSNPQRQQQRRDQCGFRNAYARATRRAFCRPWLLVPQPACSIGPPGDAPQGPRDIFVA